MSIVGSRAALAEGKCTGLIVYPRRYIVGESDAKSIIHGVDQEGAAVSIKIMPPAHFVEAAKKSKDLSVPSIENLADTGRRARNPCVASEDNGPGTRTGGVLVAEQVTVIDAEKGYYTANWASVLKDWDDCADPVVSVGYLETNLTLPINPEVERNKVELSEINQAIAKAKASADGVAKWREYEGVDLLELQATLSQELFNMANKMWFVGVEVQYRRMEPLEVSNEVAARRQLVEMIQSNSVNGMYGGVILRPYRVVDGEKVVDMSSVRQLNHQYDYVNKKIPDPGTVWDNFMKEGRGTGWFKAMASGGYAVDIIPVRRINCGSVSNATFRKDFEKGEFKRLKAYVDEAFYHAPYATFAMRNAYLASPVAVRLAKTGKSYGENLLLSTIHAFGKPFGNVLELDKDLKRSYKMSQKPAPVLGKARTRTPEPAS